MEHSKYNAESLSMALRQFEDAYGLSSDAFYARATAGENVGVPRFERHVWLSFIDDVRRLRADDADDLITRVSRSYIAA